MNDESWIDLGIFPSLHDIIRMCLKSRLRVSSTPIICIPSIGSPWKGMVVDWINWSITPFKVTRSTTKSLLLISELTLLSSVNILNTDSFSSGSFASLVLLPMSSTISIIQSTSDAKWVSCISAGDENTLARQSSIWSSSEVG